MTGRDVWEVRRHGRQWRVNRRGSHVSSSVHPSREEAVARAADLARRCSGRYRVRDLSGRVLEEGDYAALPRC
jgi:hypothetical protein